DFTGRDPTQPRDAYVLRIAATVGRLANQEQHASLSNSAVTQVTAQLTRGPTHPEPQVPDVAPAG
ncbi:MAG: hypothetical protein ACRDTN_16625, partial [Mycobacterium sp.]